MRSRSETGADVGVFAGIDVGTQGVRVVVLDEQGTCLGQAATALPREPRTSGRHEQDPDTWWSALVTSFRAAVSMAAAGGREVAIDALALDATSGTVLVESAPGVAAGPALMYDDARAGDQAARAQHAGAELWTALGYRMQPSWALPKVLWLLEHDAIRPGQHVVHQSDHLLARLTGGAVATDSSHALKTGADLRSITWPTEIFSELGIAAGVLPDLVRPGTVVGSVGTDAARTLGIGAGVPIRAGMTDGCAAQIAAAALHEGSWSTALGTTMVVKGATATPVLDPTGAIYCHRHPDGGWLPGGASSTGAGVIASTFAGADLDALTARAATLLPLDGVTYPLEGTGERFPFLAPEAVGFTVGDDADGATRFAALCLGIAYVERLAYDVLSARGADTSGTVAFTGGATRNEWWNQLRADVLGRTVLLPESSDAATGMAILAAAEPGRLAETAERMVRMRARLEPDDERWASLRPGYDRLVGELERRGWLDPELASAATGRELRR